MKDGTVVDANEKFAAIAADIYYIVPGKCTECQGFHESPQCSSVCPVDCCVPDEAYAETVEELLAKKKCYMPDQFDHLKFNEMETIEKNTLKKEVDKIVVRFSGDSGDGMQLTGMQFTDTAALLGNDLSTFPDYPSEIRAPIGTVAGVSGFQVHFGSTEIYTPGDQYDVLVAMNAAALKVDLPRLKRGGIIIANTQGFDAKNLKLANYPDGLNPLDNGNRQQLHCS